MRRSILSVVATLLAFVAGVGVNRLLWAPFEKSAVTPPTIKIVEPVKAPVLVAQVPAQASRPESRILYNFREEKFYPIGSYSFLGATPKEFTEVASFVIDYSDVQDGEEVGYMSVYTKDGEDFDETVATFGSVTERRVIFVTGPNSKTGFEYFFDGQFNSKDLNEMSGLDEVVLRGTLIKMKDGKKVAERVVSFRIQQHEC